MLVKQKLFPRTVEFIKVCNSVRTKKKLAVKCKHRYCAK